MDSVREGCLVVCLVLAGAACAGAQTGATTTAPPAALPQAPADPENEAAPPADTRAGDPSEVDAKLVAPIGESKVAEQLGVDNVKLLQIGKLSPKTHKSLMKSHLFKAIGECKDQSLEDVQAAPGLEVAAGKSVKVRSKLASDLKAAGAVAKQRGVMLVVFEGHQTIKDAVREYNAQILDAALKLIKAAPAAEQKETSYAGAAKKALGVEGPRAWSAASCESGKIGGWAVEVGLFAQGASGGLGAPLVQPSEAARFSRDKFLSTYWDKATGKNFRTLTEIMSAGGFVRQCASASLFLGAPRQDGTWRCKQDTESWDPANRPIPAWQ